MAPRPLAWQDGRVLPASEATVPLLDDGFLRGDAVFESVLVVGGRTHALDAHLARMRSSAKAIGLRLPVLRQVVLDLLAAWGQHDGVLKLVVTRGGSVRGLVQTSTWPASISLAAIEAPWHSAVSGVKTLSYAANMLVARQARERDADDALVVTDGVVQELSVGAIAFVADGQVHAPDPGQLPILDSVTIRELARITEIRFGVFHLDEVLAAQEVFAVSATRLVLPVEAIDEHIFPAPGPVTAGLMQGLRAHVDANLD